MYLSLTCCPPELSPVSSDSSIASAAKGHPRNSRMDRETAISHSLTVSELLQERRDADLSRHVSRDRAKPWMFSTLCVAKRFNMRKVIGIFIVILFSAAIGTAQGPSGFDSRDRDDHDDDDHDDDAPVQAGYAVVTPVAGTISGITTGLVVFETFGLRSKDGDSGATQAGVLPPGLTTNAILFVESS